MVGEEKQTAIQKWVFESIQDVIGKAYEARLAHDRILSMNKSHKRYWQLEKARKLVWPTAEVLLPREIHQTMKTINLTRKSH